MFGFGDGIVEDRDVKNDIGSDLKDEKYQFRYESIISYSIWSSKEEFLEPINNFKKQNKSENSLGLQAWAQAYPYTARSDPFITFTNRPI